MSVSYSQHPMPHQGSPSTYSTCPNFPIPLCSCAELDAFILGSRSKSRTRN